ncbi:MAG TPA: thioredoxin domain-containing protein [Terriglobales bacterium]|nr:thioredoxin domain-containing protein [Terriglobales bacterium]
MKLSLLKITLLALTAAVLLGAVFAFGGQSRGAAPADAAMRARVHAFLDRTLGWQGLDSITVESISAPDASGLRRAKVVLTKGQQHEDAVYLITADGKEIIEGQASPLSADPWAATRAEIDLHGAPAMGPAGAPVTLVEYSDLECPYCKQESGLLAQLMQADPGKVRLVFKFYPLTAIHPWSMLAAMAGACVAEQGDTPFWVFEKAVFDAQDQITAANATQRLAGIASESGIDTSKYQACLTAPQTRRTIDASIANGNKVGVTSTPTLFIDGRMIPGVVQEAELKQLVDHEAGYATQSTGELERDAPAGKQCGGCTPLPPLPKAAPKAK